MFNFRGKKSSSEGKTGASSATSGIVTMSASEKNDSTIISNRTPLTEEDVQHLEETKNRLFGFGKRKPNKLPPPSFLSNGSNVNTNGDHPPAVAAKPIKRPNVPPPLPKPATWTPVFESGANLLPAHTPLHKRFSEDSSSTFTDNENPLDLTGESVGFAQHVLKDFKLPGLNLPAIGSSQASERTSTLKRQVNGEFGFALRRAQGVRRSATAEKSKTVTSILYAEPLHAGVANKTGLSFGDQLLKVNGTNVTLMTRDETVALLRQSGDEVTLTVRPSPELSELSLKSAFEIGIEYDRTDESVDSVTRGDLQLRTVNRAARLKTSQSAHKIALGDEEGTQQNSVWLAHRAGFAQATLVTPGSGEGKVLIKLAGQTDEIEVDRDDIEQANPAYLNSVEDIKELVYLNESSALHVMRERYGKSLIHTYSGSQSTAIISPLLPLNIYSDKVIQMFKGCRREDMPPHIYAVAQQIYRQMQASRRNQSLVLTGRSGSGKTGQLRHFIHYLCLVAGSVNKQLVTVDKINAALNILEAFGNCKTTLSLNASRFANIFTFEFDHVGQISSGFVQCLLLECNRVARRPENESNFHIFYYFWEGLSQELKNELQLGSITDGLDAMFETSSKPADQTSAVDNFAKLISAMNKLDISESEQKVMWTLLAAIIHLGVASAPKGINSFKSQFVRPLHAQKAAGLLGVNYEDLVRTVFHSSTSSTSSPQKDVLRRDNSNLKKGRLDRQSRLARGSFDKASLMERSGDGYECLSAFICGLYKELFSLVVALINKSFASTYRTSTSITVIECPGFQNPATVASARKSANFDEFCFNYANERLNGLFYESSFTMPLEIYQQENIDVDFEEPSMSPHPLSNMLDKASQQHLLRSTNIELRSQEKRGLLWLLDEESIFPGATDESFLERLFAHNVDQKEKLLRRSKHYNHFVVKHMLGTNPVTYNVYGWLKQAQENPAMRQVLPLLQDSQKEQICSLFLMLRSGVAPGVSGGDSTQAMRRTTNIQRSLGAHLKRKSPCTMVMAQMDYLLDLIKRTTRVNFVHCFLPHHEAGLKINPEKTDVELLNVPLLRSQIRGLQLLDAVRLNKIGYPERMPYPEFRRRFDCLAPEEFKSLSSMLDEKEAVSHLLDAIELDQSQVQLGLSQIFMRSGILANLEDRRDDKLSGVVIGIQAFCRAYLVKKELERRKVRKLAVLCIQKNIRKYMVVRSWQWWKLYTKVLPLLGVQRTEEETKNQKDEIDSIRQKYEKLEKSNTELRSYCDRLEARMAETQAELQEERSSADQSSHMLEQENTQRTRLEKDYQDLKNKHQIVDKKAQKLELEVMEYRNLRAAIMSDDDSDESQYKERFEQVKKQLDTQKKQHEQEKKEESEHFQQIKKQLDKKLTEAQREMSESDHQTQEHKRKAKRANEELQDLKMHLQTLSARNTELEKKQKKFDSEVNAVQSDYINEKVIREKLQREKDLASAEVYKHQQQLRDQISDAEVNDRKMKLLQEEIDELSRRGTTAVNSDLLVELRRHKSNLEEKVKEQEEELDELAGTRQQLEQNVLKLNMQVERMRNDHLKELESKEDEIGEARAQAQRKVKSLEHQLEDEYDSKQTIQREKRELEVKCRELSDHHVVRDVAAEASLRSQLRKTKALLKDAQQMLQLTKDSAPNRGIVKQLRNQLEDAEAEKMFAVKIKQNFEFEVNDMKHQVDQASVAKQEIEERCLQLMKDKNSLLSQLEDADEERAELIKKYKAQVQQSSVDHITLNDQFTQIADLSKERENLKEQVAELFSKLQYMDSETVDKHKLLLSDSRVRDLDAKLGLELSIKTRLESQITKLKEQLESVQTELTSHRAARDKDQEVQRRLQRQLTEVQDSLNVGQKRESEAVQKRSEIEQSLEREEKEHQDVIKDLKLALRRVDDLQHALEEDIRMSAGEDDDDSYFVDDDDNSSDFGENESISANAILATRTASTADTISSALSNWSSPRSGDRLAESTPLVSK